VKGHPDLPMSMDDCEAKFWNCAPYAARELPRENLEAAVARVRALETLDDVGEIVRLLS
jgi:hypothetical protein